MERQRLTCDLRRRRVVAFRTRLKGAAKRGGQAKGDSVHACMEVNPREAARPFSPLVAATPNGLRSGLEAASSMKLAAAIGSRVCCAMVRLCGHLSA